MKYNELEKKIKKAGCFDTGKQMAGQVATGTLNAILKAAGLK